MTPFEKQALIPPSIEDIGYLGYPSIGPMGIAGWPNASLYTTGLAYTNRSWNWTPKNKKEEEKMEKTENGKMSFEELLGEVFDGFNRQYPRFEGSDEVVVALIKTAAYLCSAEDRGKVIEKKNTEIQNLRGDILALKDEIADLKQANWELGIEAARCREKFEELKAEKKEAEDDD